MPRHAPLPRSLRRTTRLRRTGLEHFFLNGQEVARFVKRTALAAGMRGDLPEDEREMLFAGYSLRAGLASSAEVDECFVQKQLGHAVQR